MKDIQSLHSKTDGFSIIFRQDGKGYQFHFGKEVEGIKAFGAMLNALEGCTKFETWDVAELKAEFDAIVNGDKS